MTSTQGPIIQGNNIVGSAISIGSNASAHVTGPTASDAELYDVIRRLESALLPTEGAPMAQRLLVEASSELAQGNGDGARRLLGRLAEGIAASAIATEMLPLLHAAARGAF